jgi:hypothetical protein
MEQQHVCRAVEASTRRPVRAGSSKDDPARPHQAGQHDKDRQRQGSVLPKIPSIFDQTLDRAVEMAATAYNFPSRSFVDLRKNGQGVQYLANKLLIPPEELVKLIFGLVTVGLPSNTISGKTPINRPKLRLVT